MAAILSRGDQLIALYFQWSVVCVYDTMLDHGPDQPETGYLAQWEQIKLYTHN